MSRFNYLKIDVCYWQQIVDQETNKKRNFEPFNSELLYVAQAFLNSYKYHIQQKGRAA
jgi:hypothetical protein